MSTPGPNATPAPNAPAEREQPLCVKLFSRDREILIAVVILIVVLNIPFGQFVLYPFMIFSTWVHEMCHGMAAIFVGGEISSLRVYPDGSGLAFTSVGHYEDQESFKMKRAFVSSAGYMGTALVGCFLLLFRRTKYGPTIGTITLGALMIISCILWIRNVWGAFVILFMGVLVLGPGCMAAFEYRIKKVHLGYLYALLALTSSLNALVSIQVLFASNEYSVGGEMIDSDAHTVAEYLGGDAFMWAFLWLLFALLCSAVGILFPIDSEATCCPTSCPFACSSSCCERSGSSTATTGTDLEKNTPKETEIVRASTITTTTTPSINWATETEVKEQPEKDSSNPSWANIT